jgi:hypothetical protein
MGGSTPKFACVVPPDDELNVKYGKGNGEVYAEVAAARLFWALGFGAERMHPVRVDCKGCPPPILHDTDVASVERKLTLENPRISEEGRQFLANLLAQLTDAQLHDLFEVARFPQRWDRRENPENAATVDQWVDAFEKKRDTIVNHHCVGS